MSSNNNPDGEIKGFYHEKSIFVTGGTGFLGKVLIRKLVDSCPTISKIYLLIRHKRNKAPQDRLNDLFKSPIFQDLHEDHLSKIKALSGDITEPELGLSKEDLRTVIDEVSIIFHSAATVRFDEDLSKSVKMNVEGTLSVINLAHKMQRLEALVHVSTAYAHCYQSRTEERFYINNQINLDDAIEECRNNPDESAIIGQHPNTYTYTKALAEQLILQKGQTLPITIVRPSIVVATWKKPFAGWVDNFNGPTGIIAAAATGILRTMLVNREKRADLIPVDIIVNVMIVAAWKIAQTQDSLSIPPIFNVTSGDTNPITWGDLETWILPMIKEYPFENLLWYPGGTFKSSATYDRVCRWIFHYLPAFLVDGVLTILRKKTFLRNIVFKMTRSMRALHYFSTREWYWTNDNLKRLRSDLAQTDEHSIECFDFDISTLDWYTFIFDYVLGTRHYVLKNSPTTLDWSRKKLKILHLCHFFIQLMFAFLLYYLFLF